jgi:hypothetical protein
VRVAIGFEVESSRESSGLAARPFGFNWGTEKGTGAICQGVQQGMDGMQVVRLIKVKTCENSADNTLEISGGRRGPRSHEGTMTGRLGAVCDWPCRRAIIPHCLNGSLIRACSRAWMACKWCV